MRKTQSRLEENPTKQQEIDHFQQFVDMLPASCYLRSILTDCVGNVTSQIRDDIAVPEFLHDLWREKFAQQEELGNVKGELAAAQAKLQEARKEKDELDSEIYRLRNSARQHAYEFKSAVEALEEL